MYVCMYVCMYLHLLALSPFSTFASDFARTSGAAACRRRLVQEVRSRDRRRPQTSLRADSHGCFGVRPFVQLESMPTFELSGAYIASELLLTALMYLSDVSGQRSLVPERLWTMLALQASPGFPAFDLCHAVELTVVARETQSAIKNCSANRALPPSFRLHSD